METQHTFSPGQTAHTIWGEKLTLQENKDPDYPLFIPTYFFGGKRISVTIDGRYMANHKFKIIYPHPVRVTPIPKFEEGEEIEVADSPTFNQCIQTIFLFKNGDRYYSPISYREGDFISGSMYINAVGWKYARKITKPEKTTEELKADLIEHQEMLIVLFEAWFNNREGINEHDLKLLKDKISSLKEQIKQKS